MRKAWIQNDRIRDIAPGNPDELYHPDVAKFYADDVPDDAANGDGWDGVTLTKPVIPDPVAPPAPAAVPPKVGPIEFQMLFTMSEQIAIEDSPDRVIRRFMKLVEDPRLPYIDLSLTSVSDALDYMTGLGLLAVGRKAEILTGVLR